MFVVLGSQRPAPGHGLALTVDDHAVDGEVTDHQNVDVIRSQDNLLKSVIAGLLQRLLYILANCL